MPSISWLITNFYSGETHENHINWTYSSPSFVASFAMNSRHNMNHVPATQFKRVQSNGITLSNFHARASIGHTKNSGIYGKIQAVKTDRLVNMSTSFASVAELHEHINDDGVMRMRKKRGLMINPVSPL